MVDCDEVIAEEDRRDLEYIFPDSFSHLKIFTNRLGQATLSLDSQYACGDVCCSSVFPGQGCGR